ncbi:LysR substrate-binding domain-containing protein [Rhodopila sp.]|uniref:LysR substrate-binding domain-containing protein n=1 Tax=Rhodopila sp. TaxID=2480087 RepID=UPI003D0DA27F
MVPSPGHRRLLPPLNAVRAFEAAARHGSFKAAAAELAVTHGAVSRQVALLEEWLGVPALFRRLSRGVALTPDGDALLAECGPALDRIAAAARQHRARRGERAARVLRVNALATFSLRWLLPRLGLFRERYPGIEVRLTTSNAPIDGLAEDYDVVIRGGPDSFLGFVSHPVVGERRLPVCSPGLARRLALNSIADLEGVTLLHVATMPRLWRDWLTEAGHGGLQPIATLTLDHFYLSIQAAIDGLGVAMGPTALVGDELASGRLMTPFPAVSLPARSYFAYVPQAGRANPASGAFLEWLAAQGAVAAGR